MTTLNPTTSTAPDRRIHLRDVIHGEWIKFRSVRSTKLTLIVAGIVTVALGMIFSATAGSGEAAPGPAAALTDPVQLALGAIDLTALSLIHISEPTRLKTRSRMPSSA